MQNPLQECKIQKVQKEDKGKTPNPTQGKPHKFAQYIVVHCHIRVTEDLFHTSYASRSDT